MIKLSQFYQVLQTETNACLFIFVLSFVSPSGSHWVDSYIYMPFFLHRFRCGGFVLWLALRYIDFSSAKALTACSKAEQNALIMSNP